MAPVADVGAIGWDGILWNSLAEECLSSPLLLICSSAGLQGYLAHEKQPPPLGPP